MSQNNRTIWTTSLGNVVELPPCPTDMSEPLYAALVFDRYCFVSSYILVLSASRGMRLKFDHRAVAIMGPGCTMP